jgi:hypothetical protein
MLRLQKGSFVDGLGVRRTRVITAYFNYVNNILTQVFTLFLRAVFFRLVLRVSIFSVFILEAKVCLAFFRRVGTKTV